MRRYETDKIGRVAIGLPLPAQQIKESPTSAWARDFKGLALFGGRSLWVRQGHRGERNHHVNWVHTKQCNLIETSCTDM